MAHNYKLFSTKVPMPWDKVTSKELFDQFGFGLKKANKGKLQFTEWFLRLISPNDDHFLFLLLYFFNPFWIKQN